MRTAMLACFTFIFAMVAVGVYYFLSREGGTRTPENRPPSLAVQQDEQPWFENIVESSGVKFRHFDPASEFFHIVETVGSGVAWIDYDGDGLLDLLLVQSGPLFPKKFSRPLPTHGFYRNLGSGKFSEITKEVGLDQSGLGMGAAVADYDNDGYDDLLITYFDHVSLFRNEANPKAPGGRHFVQVTEKAGVAAPGWATSAAWGDIDNDGFLDLYICHYVDVQIDGYEPCNHSEKKLRYQCPPTLFPSGEHKLYRNRGDGTFENITKSAGIVQANPGPGFAVMMVDLDGDGRIDIYVANDMKPAFLFRNLGQGKFEEISLTAGCALQPNGRLIAGMGVDIADLTESHLPSLLVTNFQREPNMLFLNRGKMQFDESSYPAGLAGTSLSKLAFGCAFLDADSDGILDLAIANGHITRNAQEVFGDPYAQEPQFFRGEPKARFKDYSKQVGPYFLQRKVSRGLAYADFENNGRVGLVYNNIGEPPGLLRNATRTKNHWIRLELEGDGKKTNRNAIGAKVEIEAGGKKQIRWVVGGGSFLSASDRRLNFGLGSAEKVDAVRVHWPNGNIQVLGSLSGDVGYILKEGNSTPKARN